MKKRADSADISVLFFLIAVLIWEKFPNNPVFFSDCLSNIYTQPSIQKGVKNENHMICYLVLLFQIIYDALVNEIGILQ